MTEQLTAPRPGPPAGGTAGGPPTPAQVRRSRAGYGALRAVGAVLAAAMIGGATVSLVPDMARQEVTSTVTVDGSALASLEQAGAVLVEGSRKDVVVREARAGERPSVTTTAEWAFNEPELRLDEGPDGLAVSAPCPSGNWGICAVGFELVVPAGTAVEVRATLGDVDVVSTGDVTVTSSLGDVSVGGDPGTVRVTSSLGDIRVSGTPGTVHAEASLGSIRVLAQEPPDLVSATTSLGDVHLEVPGGVSYAVDTDTNQGDRDVQVSRDPASPHTLRARTSLGAIQIVPAG